MCVSIISVITQLIGELTLLRKDFLICCNISVSNIINGLWLTAIGCLVVKGPSWLTDQQSVTQL